MGEECDNCGAEVPWYIPVVIWAKLITDFLATPLFVAMTAYFVAIGDLETASVLSIFSVGVFLAFLHGWVLDHRVYRVS